jgi:hypothetical protein
MCYILCMTSLVSATLRRGVFAWGFGASAPEEIFFPQEMSHIFASFFVLPQFSCPLLGGFSAHGFLPMVFYFRLRN